MLSKLILWPVVEQKLPRDNPDFVSLDEMSTSDVQSTSWFQSANQLRTHSFLDGFIDSVTHLLIHLFFHIRPVSTSWPLKASKSLIHFGSAETSVDKTCILLHLVCVMQCFSW